MTKTLIAYFSYSGNTRHLAELIRDQTNGDLFQIKERVAYSTDFQSRETRAKQEAEQASTPELLVDLESIENYDRIFIGTPNWFNTMAPPVRTFLTNKNWQDKELILFNTNGGGGLGRILADVQQNTTGANLQEAFTISENRILFAEDKLIDWLNTLAKNAA